MHIEGPAGKLEYEIDKPLSGTNKPLAVLCHPHPLYGGSMHDAILSLTTAVLLKHEIMCVRFNFRGVGSSEGRHDKGEGEREDLKAITDHFSTLHPEKPLWLVGYSFGASVAWKTIPEIKPESVLLVAPPIKHMEFKQHGLSNVVSVVAGDQDEYIDLQKLKNLEIKSLSILQGSDHFFTGQSAEFSSAVDEFTANKDPVKK